MAKRMTPSELLKNLTSISMGSSDGEYDDESELLESQSDRHDSSDDSIIIKSIGNESSDRVNTDEEIDSDSDYENIPKKRRCMRLPSSSEDEGGSEIQNRETEMAADGTVWRKIQEGGVVGRLPIHSVFKDSPGPTAHAKRNIMKGELSSAFFLLIDHHILEHIITCTELEASRVLGKKWILTQSKLKAFIAILYARGAYEAKNLRHDLLWNIKWGPKFFSTTLSRRDFTEILRFIRFDKKMRGVNAYKGTNLH